MKCAKDKIIKKIKSTSGMSLGEMLVSVLILLLATSVLTRVMSLGLNEYNNSMRASEANVLSSTLQTIMTNELAYTTEIYVENGEVSSFQSQNYAIQDTLSNFIIDSADSGGFGKVLIGSETSNKKLLGDGSYPRKLGVKINSFTYDATTSYFTINFSIGCGSQTYVDQTFQVLNVNHTKVS